MPIKVHSLNTIMNDVSFSQKDTTSTLVNFNTFRDKVCK